MKGYITTCYDASGQKFVSASQAFCTRWNVTHESVQFYHIPYNVQCLLVSFSDKKTLSENKAAPLALPERLFCTPCSYLPHCCLAPPAGTVQRWAKLQEGSCHEICEGWAVKFCSTSSHTYRWTKRSWEPCKISQFQPREVPSFQSSETEIFRR